MAAKSKTDDAPVHRPYVPADSSMPEFTWSAVLMGAVLGIVFGASSLYLTLKVGMTVSASIPVAVLSITVFRGLSKLFGVRRATILENNIVQTTGSAGESIAFGIGVTIPALMLLGFDMEVVRVMTVGLLGGLLGILMMIPLRRAFIVRQHGTLPYPEGTACADVLIVGEEGGSSAKTVFAGFGIALVHKILMNALGLWKEKPTQALVNQSGQGLRGAEIGGELTPELLGVGYIIGPKIASITFAGGVLAYLVIAPLIVYFGEQLAAPLLPEQNTAISQMKVSDIRNSYILYIGAGAVATGGIISMFQAMPMIIGSIVAGLRDLKKSRAAESAGHDVSVKRTDRDLPLSVVIVGSLAMVVMLAAVPSLGLGFTWTGLLSAVLVVLFGFLFVTVSSRLTGLIGSSSNPISGMTVAALLLTCLIFVFADRMGWIELGKPVTLTALTIAAVVCIAASNGGTTAQDLKTGFLVGATPRSQQWAILIGAFTSALVLGGVLLLLDHVGTVYTNNAQYLPPPDFRVPAEVVEKLDKRERVRGHHAETDQNEYRVLHVAEGEVMGLAAGRYLVDEDRRVAYLVDPAINGKVAVTDDDKKVTNKFDAPKTRLMALIIDGILNQKLPWTLVIIGALISITLELARVPALPFAVGVYLPIQTSTPIFIGGMLRWLVDRRRKRAAAEQEFSPGVLLCSGYIAGGAIAGVLIAFLALAPAAVEALNLSSYLSDKWSASNWPSIGAFTFLVIVLALVGFEKFLRSNDPSPSPRQAGK